MSPTFADVSETEFEQAVIERSFHMPVLVDFWATWCAPCKVLKPVLEKLADEFQGKFFLAKIETEANQQLAMQFGIRGVPAVKAFIDGKIVDEFSGALPENQIREFLDRIIPSPGETLRLEAESLHQRGESTLALQRLAEASELDPGNEKIHITSASILTDIGEIDEARRLLDNLSPATHQEQAVVALITRIGFAEKGNTGDINLLEQKIASNENDLAARLELANALLANQQYEPALKELLEIVQRDRTFGGDIGRKTMLSAFTLLGADPLVSKYRRLLASALN